MRSRHLRARALITASLAGVILLSIVPGSSVMATEPTDPTAPVETPTPTPTDVAPTTPTTPTSDPAPSAEPVPAAEPAPAAAKPPIVRRPRTTEAQQIIRIAMRQRGDPWRYAARGPRAFDCSGLVIYAFKRAGDERAVGRGHLASARALYHWYKARGLASRHHPRVGDLVIWGGGSHVGIYIGHGRAISTLTSGVRVHRVHAVTARFTAYLHTGMWKKAAS